MPVGMNGLKCAFWGIGSLIIKVGDEETANEGFCNSVLRRKAFPSNILNNQRRLYDGE